MLQSVVVCSISTVGLFRNPTDCSPPGFSVHGIFQATVLEWVAISFSRGPSQSKDGTQVSCISCIGRQILYYCAIREDLCYNYSYIKVNILEGSMELSGACGEGFPPFSNSYYYYDQNTTDTGLNCFKTIDQRSKECVSGVPLARRVDLLLQKSNYYGK